MTNPPALDPSASASPIEPRYALLINPFYPKDPNASYGKHVLTPSLALTSFAAATPEHWRIQYSDENLLSGRPPFQPMPEVVGITVHLTFARRAFELADWYRRRGSKVVMGGLHVLSCPEECAPHADALALGDGVQLWPRILADIESGRLQRRYAATYENDYREDPAPRRSILPRKSFLTKGRRSESRKSRSASRAASRRKFWTPVDGAAKGNRTPHAADGSVVRPT
jgi:radical SAM superfamily enzyme YgiQ (UPF0313 family)